MNTTDDKYHMGAVPPYEANPSHGVQQTGSYGAAPPGQPTVQQDIYQQPISPMQTGQEYQQHPISPMQTGQTYPQQPQHTGSMDQTYTRQPQQTGVASPGNEKQEYYSAGPQPPMQQQQMGGAPMQQQMQPTQTYQSATPLANLTAYAAPVDCPMCRQRAMTRAEPHAGNTTHVWALVLCACFCLGCIPYLMSSLKDVEHKCGNCGCMLATWHRSGRVDVHAHA